MRIKEVLLEPGDPCCFPGVMKPSDLGPADDDEAALMALG
jgi:hypothetical protein